MYSKDKKRGHVRIVEFGCIMIVVAFSYIMYCVLHLVHSGHVDFCGLGKLLSVDVLGELTHLCMQTGISVIHVITTYESYI
jgi:hypothetical protein